jgi:hypothetical protein
MPIIPATWEAEIRRITVQDQPGGKTLQDAISTNKLGDHEQDGGVEDLSI